MIGVIGENVVDLLPDSHGAFLPCLGGSPFNLAIGIARQGIAVSYLSPLSSDRFGQAFNHYLYEAGGQYGLPFFSDAPSSLALVSLDEHKQPSYSLYRQGIADRTITAEQQIAALSDPLRILHLGSLALEPEDAPRLRAVIQAAAERHILLSLDINVRLNAVSNAHTYRQFLQEVIAHSQLIKASDEDLALLYPQLTAEQALTAIRTLAPEALITMTEGEKGASLYWQQHQFSLPVVPATPFIDTVGAGDTFWANMLGGLLRHNLPDAAQISTPALKQLMQQAMLAASLNIRRQGCQPPTRAEVLQALPELETLPVA